MPCNMTPTLAVSEDNIALDHYAFYYFLNISFVKFARNSSINEISLFLPSEVIVLYISSTFYLTFLPL